MKHVVCYDNEGKTADRYTVIFTNRKNPNGTYDCLGMNEHPFHPQGFGQHSTAARGRHLGKKIQFENLPPDCQKFVKQNLEEQE
jgi:hypothetical protein